MKLNRKSKPLVLIVAMALVATMAIGGTMAWFQVNSDKLTNAFTPGEVGGEVVEDFTPGGGVKSNVAVKNTGNVEAYVRVALVPTWQDESGNILPETASIENLSFTPGSGWFVKDGFYYYKNKVAASATTANLADRITVTGAPEGARMNLQILTEVIQANPADAVTESWGIMPNSDGTLG